ncbi:hypothetical protein ABZX92_38645 [Lentzea sp. NPDC006480]|uniref:hypothetical protein n=1 Tax=Lentzea sp. NPDC006480 TaxID=3157176 RepID=UPI0033B9B6FB
MGTSSTSLKKIVPGVFGWSTSPARRHHGGGGPTALASESPTSSWNAARLALQRRAGNADVIMRSGLLS